MWDRCRALGRHGHGACAVSPSACVVASWVCSAPTAIRRHVSISRIADTQSLGKRPPPFGRLGRLVVQTCNMPVTCHLHPPRSVGRPFPSRIPSLVGLARRGVSHLGLGLALIEHDVGAGRAVQLLHPRHRGTTAGAHLLGAAIGLLGQAAQRGTGEEIAGTLHWITTSSSPSRYEATPHP